MAYSVKRFNKNINVQEA